MEIRETVGIDISKLSLDVWPKMALLPCRLAVFADGIDDRYYTAHGGLARVRDSSGILFCGAVDGENLCADLAFGGLVGLKLACTAPQKRYSG